MDGYGWQNGRCGVENQVFEIGEGGLGHRIYGLEIWGGPDAGGFCFRPYVAWYGWRDPRCGVSAGVNNGLIYWLHNQDPPRCNGSWLGGCVPAFFTNYLQAITIWRY